MDACTATGAISGSFGRYKLLSDEDATFEEFAQKIGSISSSKMYASGCPDIEPHSGIWEFIIGMDVQESHRINADHELIRSNTPASDRSVRRAVTLGNIIGTSIAMPVIAKFPGMIGTACSIAIIAANLGIGFMYGYKSHNYITKEIELDRLRRLADKISLINIQCKVFEKSERIAEIRNLNILKNFFEKTLNEKRDITYFSLEKNDANGTDRSRTRSASF